VDIDRWAKSTRSEKGGIDVRGRGKRQKQPSKIIIISKGLYLLGIGTITINDLFI